MKVGVASIGECSSTRKAYLSDFQSVQEADAELKVYFEFYNHARLHQALDYSSPAQVYGMA